MRRPLSRETTLRESARFCVDAASPRSLGPPGAPRHHRSSNPSPLRAATTASDLLLRFTFQKGIEGTMELPVIPLAFSPCASMLRKELAQTRADIHAAVKVAEPNSECDYVLDPNSAHAKLRKSQVCPFSWSARELLCPGQVCMPSRFASTDFSMRHCAGRHLPPHRGVVTHGTAPAEESRVVCRIAIGFSLVDEVRTGICHNRQQAINSDLIACFPIVSYRLSLAAFLG